MPKPKLPSFFHFKRHEGNISVFQALVMRLLIVFGPLLIAILLISYVGLFLIAMCILSVPYAVWRLICKIYKWKDMHRNLEE